MSELLEELKTITCLVAILILVCIAYPLDTPDDVNGWFDPKISPCNRTGIKCEEDGLTVSHIAFSCAHSRPQNLPFFKFIAEFRSLKQINLSHCRLFGEIKDYPELWNLEHLEVLDLSYNRFSGVLPSSIAKLKSLKQLILDGNHFSGSLPPEIGELGDQLVELSLHSNSFSGQLPEQLGKLNKLESLDISGNAFSGTLPKSLGNLTGLLYFSAHRNDFSGPLFHKIGRLWRLRILDLGRNSFTGNIPSSIGNLTHLTELDLGNCLFTGTVPEEISNLTSLMHLNFGGNDFIGELPLGIGTLLDLNYFIASHSGLTGNIPWQLGKCKKLKIVNLSFNSLNGPLPNSLSELKSVTTFLVSSNSLSGPVPAWISNWKELKSISLSENLFSGPLPRSIFSELPVLSHFDVSSNNLSGELPEEMCAGKNGRTSLARLDLSRNKFSGRIENVFNACLSLTDLILDENNFSGEIPPYFGELQLIILGISKNKLTGKIPDKLWESKTLMEISLSDNLLNGPISTAVANATTLGRLLLENNLLTGTIPRSIGKLTNLTNLSLQGNQLTGNIPEELFDCKKLVSLNLGNNQLQGQISKSVSQLKFLDNLVLSDNWISGPIPEEICSNSFQKNVPFPDSEFIQHYGMLDLSHNELEGPVPTSVGNCTVLTHLILKGNKLNGTIPTQELTSLSNLTLLDLSSNAFSGSLSPDLFKMPSLQGLILSNNQLNGSIPDPHISMIGQTVLERGSRLTKLDLSKNRFAGFLPPSLFSVQSLTYLDVSMNFLSGPLSIRIESRWTTALVVLNASNNRFSGPLVESISNLTSLSVLDLHRNTFTGTIPPSLSELAVLTYLDLSENHFQDSNFPCNICAIQGLTYANFSGNDFQTTNYKNHQKYCADVKPCNDILLPDQRQETRSSLFSIVVSLGLIFVFVSFIIGIILMKWKTRKQQRSIVLAENQLVVRVPNSTSISDRDLFVKKRKEPISINVAIFEHFLLRISPSDILSSTENFNERYIIGQGGFGTVYRASLRGGRTIAVKRLNGGQMHGEREFMAEMETLGKVKHGNLVPLLGYCVFGDERFLIYEYMENGSLDFWLRNKHALDWPTRFKICLGSAKGLSFLHHGFVPHIIHRDIKSSNILLDENFQPRVSDFGLARIVSACESHVSTMLAGTFGYIPPEYGQTMVATKNGDVYSFGVVMLELVTGREPTGQEDGEGGNLVGWVRWMVEQGRKDEIVNGNVCGCWKDEMLCVVEIASWCTRDEPWRRPTMLEVVKLLNKVRFMVH